MKEYKVRTKSLNDLKRAKALFIEKGLKSYPSEKTSSYPSERELKSIESYIKMREYMDTKKLKDDLNDNRIELQMCIAESYMLKEKMASIENAIELIEKEIASIEKQ